MKETIVTKSVNTKILAEAIVFIALANVLYVTSKFYFGFLHLPQGGSVSFEPLKIIV